MSNTSIIYTIVGGVLILISVFMFIFSYFYTSYNLCSYRNSMLDLFVAFLILPVAGYFLYIGLTGTKINTKVLLGITIPCVVLSLICLIWNMVAGPPAGFIVRQDCRENIVSAPQEPTFTPSYIKQESYIDNLAPTAPF